MIQIMSYHTYKIPELLVRFYGHDRQTDYQVNITRFFFIWEGMDPLPLDFEGL